MLQNLSGWHALVILVIVLLVFGSSKLPLLAKSVGQSMRILKDEVHENAAAVTAQNGSSAAADDHAVATATSIDPVSGRRAS